MAALRIATRLRLPAGQAAPLPLTALARAAAAPLRALSTRGGGGGGRREQEPLSPREAKLKQDMEDIVQAMEDRMKFSQDPPKLRGLPPPPPTHVHETWAPAALVSPLPEENALTFRTRFYIDATGLQQNHSVKVQVNVKIKRLGLSAEEEARLIAVSRQYYRKKSHELQLACQRYLEVPRNKAHLRGVISRLLADARTNATAHAETPDAQKPLAARAEPWLAGDKRAFQRRPPLYFKVTHKSPG